VHHEPQQVHSKDDEGMGANHEVTLPKNQPELS